MKRNRAQTHGSGLEHSSPTRGLSGAKRAGNRMRRLADFLLHETQPNRSDALVAAVHGRIDGAVQQARLARSSYDPSDRVRRLKRALVGTTALVAVALAETLTLVELAPSAYAQGGGTGGPSQSGNIGGGGGATTATGTGNPGHPGAFVSSGGGGGGGGGGAGVYGGAGGCGASDGGLDCGSGSGGAGGAFAGADGSPGSRADVLSGSGGGGGGGGAHGYHGSTLPFEGALGGKGGYGGQGGKGSVCCKTGGGGGGGAGGFGALVTGSTGALSDLVNATGGQGGTGGAGGGGDRENYAGGGNGGDGGVGLWLNQTSQVTLGSYSRIAGGDGGTGGTILTGPTKIGPGGTGGTGGGGLVLVGTTGSIVTNNGMIRGGDGGTSGYGFQSTGGNGGYGVSVTGGNLINSGYIKAGDGGNANTQSEASLSKGGAGGYGVTLGDGDALTNSGTIKGGNGGNGGPNFNSAAPGGNGGYGVTLGDGGTLTNSGTITGGNGGNGGYSFRNGNGGTGATGVSATGGTLTNSGTITGGNGGNGGGGLYLVGGNGAKGGIGVSIANAATLINSSTIEGGNGGTGANGVGGIFTVGGSGGYGGIGVSIANGATLINSSTIKGGNGGSGGTGRTNGAGGYGGWGVYVNSGTVINSGTIYGGLADGGSGSRSRAITFGGGTNKLELWNGSTINGNVAATTGANDTLALGGMANGTFNVSQIGSQYQGFEAFEKTGSSTWTLMCTTACPTSVTPWTINQGVLSISSDNMLGDTSGVLTFNGGTLQNTAAFSTTRSITLLSGGGIFNTAADLTVTAVISGSGALTKFGAGTLTLTGTNTYTGGTFIDEGTLSVSSDGNLGAATGVLAFIDGGTLQNTTAFTTARNVALIGIGTFQTDADLTVSGVVSDLLPFAGGAPIKTGSGTLTLTGNNTYTSGTTISAGTLQIGNGGTSGSIVGDVVNNGVLTFNRSDDLSYGGAISGTGALTKLGAGTLTLTGASTYSGDTTINAGTLRVAGTLGAGAVSVDSGATLAGPTLTGSGSIGGTVTVQNGGILAGANTATNSGASLSMGALVLNAASSVNVAIGTPSGTLFDVGGNLTLAGTLNVTDAGGYGPGVYQLFEYGSLTDNGLTLGSRPAGFVSRIDTKNTAQHQVNLVVYDDPTKLQFWQGSVGGGTGMWRAGDPNWLNADGSQSTVWGSVHGVFEGNPGTVTIEGPQSFETLEFVSDGYNLVAGQNGALTATGTARLWAEGVRTTATIATSITGTGGIVKIGAGTVVLTGANTYSGGTAIDAGTLSVSSDANLGDASGGLSFNGGTLENTAAFTTARAITLATRDGTFRTTADLTATGIISGPGALTKTGAGTLTLTRVNTYSGGTIIKAGTLSVSADPNLGDALGGLSFDGGALESTATFTTGRAITLAPGGGTFRTTADLTVTGLVSGAGALIKAGSGTLTLTGNNTYSGGTTIAAGTVRIGDGGTAGSIVGDVANNGVLAFDRSDDLSYGGAVSGSGALTKFGAGRLTLTGNSTYTGGTTISAGTLRIGDGGTSGSIVGDVVNNGVLAVDRSDDLSYAGAISGTGALAKFGAGRLTLTGANTYIGGTTISAGTLSVAADAHLGAASGGLTFNGGTLENTAALSTARGITLGAGGGTFNTVADLTATGIISGPGALTKVGSGRLTLTGANIYTGGTTIAAGTLRIGDGGTSGSVVGDVVNHSVLAFDRADDFSYAGAVSGAGVLAKFGAGRLTLTGTNTYGGGTTIAAGTLRIGDGGASGSIIGNVVNNGVLAFDRSNDLSYGGTISGSGALAKFGAGRLTLTGTNTYSGGTTINAGTVAISSNANLGNVSGGLIFNGGALENTSAFTMARAITLEAGGGAFNAAADLTVTSIISGPGALTKTGASRLTLTGTNTYTGGTSINAGTLHIGNGGTSGSIVGDVLNNGVLAFDRSDNLTYDGTVSGTGELAKLGAGRLTLTGTHSYTGDTTVDRGALIVNGSIAESNLLTVNVGGLVGGIGTLPATTINGGTLSPGNSIGTISVQGNLAFSTAATYLVEVSATATDRTNISGTAALAGTVRVVATPDDYRPRTRYIILHADGGVSGTETLSAVSTAFLDPSFSDDGNNVFLDLTLRPFSSAARTPNQHAVANALQAGINSVLGAAVLNLPTAADARRAFDALSGEVHASVAGSLADDSRYVRSAVLSRLRQAPYAEGPLAALGIGGPELAYQPSPQEAYAANLPVKAPPIALPRRPDLTFWSQGYGAWGTFEGNGNAATVERSLGGVLVGLDGSLTDGWRVGFAAGYSQSKIRIGARASSASVDSGHVALYGDGSFGAWNLRGGAAYANHQIDTSRWIAFPGFVEQAKSQYGGATAQVFGELGYGFEFGRMAAEPFAGLAWVHLHANGFREAGDLAALIGSGSTQDVGYSTIGARFAATFALVDRMALTPRASFAWQHAFNDVTPAVELTFQSTGMGFGITGVPLARDSALVEAGLDLRVTSQATLGVSYLGQLADAVQDHAVKGQFTWRF
ncbi:autotransporter-associated beta strand repeat-containing protein [Bradyrhizobium sp. LHD-71]|uniref:autotransporter-associated beta strand repeat-containing protein n=1 Tax=Bradyrhizobium sp. LHD-71 TaxID=3072141 RepID=UPI00280E341F|nr:autotransporter-associated beta strand repeat-containing protein [Bradyrhizobium sp. LHD-71]MDQ8728877.1 autotransporter-associated beta strand repeat-containing protein [Bradyrhizobium sp. LHD-71]